MLLPTTAKRLGMQVRTQEAKRAGATRAHRPQKITFGEMRNTGVRGILIYCSDYKCSHSIAISADRWPDHVRLSDLEARFVCKGCGKKGADVRPLFVYDHKPW
jgi:hypothetical protein